MHICHLCRECQWLCRVVRYCTLAEEVAPERAKRGVIRQALAAEDQAVNASLYILLRAVDRFQATCGRFPGALSGYAPSLLTDMITFVDQAQKMPCSLTCIPNSVLGAGKMHSACGH